MTNGFVGIPYSIIRSEEFTDLEPRQRLLLYELYALANWGDGEVVRAGNPVRLSRGQVCNSLRWWSERIGYSRPSILRALKLFSGLGWIAVFGETPDETPDETGNETIPGSMPHMITLPNFLGISTSGGQLVAANETLRETPPETLRGPKNNKKLKTEEPKAEEKTLAFEKSHAHNSAVKMDSAAVEKFLAGEIDQDELTRLSLEAASKTTAANSTPSPVTPPPVPKTPSPRNVGVCAECGEVIESRHRHDMVWCSCGASAVDGGTDYFKWTGAVVVDPEFQRPSAKKSTPQSELVGFFRAEMKRIRNSPYASKATDFIQVARLLKKGFTPAIIRHRMGLALADKFFFNPSIAAFCSAVDRWAPPPGSKGYEIAANVWSEVPPSKLTAEERKQLGAA